MSDRIVAERPRSNRWFLATASLVLALAMVSGSAKPALASAAQGLAATADDTKDKKADSKAAPDSAAKDKKTAPTSSKTVAPAELEKRKAEITALNTKINEVIAAAIEAGKLKDAKAGIDDVAGKLAAYVKRTSTPQWHATVAPTYQLLEKKRVEFNKKLKATNGNEKELLETLPKIPPDAVKQLTVGKRALQGVASKLARKERMEAAQLLKEGEEALEKAISIVNLPDWQESVATMRQLIDQHSSGLKTELASVAQSKDSIDEGGLKVGAMAPPFDAKTLDNKPLSSKDFEGKWMLIDFWATWCGPCVGEIPHLKEVYKEFGQDKRFVMISLTIDDGMLKPKSFTKEKGMNWVQGFLGKGWGAPLLKLYGVRGIPAIFLISPEGKVVERGLRGEKIKEAVAKALKEKPTT